MDCISVNRVAEVGLLEYIESNETELRAQADRILSLWHDFAENEIIRNESSLSDSPERVELEFLAPLDIFEEEIESDLEIDHFQLVVSASVTYAYMKHGQNDNVDFSDKFAAACYEMDEENWIYEIFVAIAKNNLEESLGRYYPNFHSFTVNYFPSDKDIEPGNFDPVFRPLIKIFNTKGEQRDSVETIMHELTHAYINENTGSGDFGKNAKSIDEAAGWTVSYLYGAEGLPSLNQMDVENQEPGYDKLKTEVFQAACHIFRKSGESGNIEESVSEVRRRAVDAINKVSGGEDPIKALIEEDEIVSEVIRVASYVTKRVSDKKTKEYFSHLGLAEVGDVKFQDYNKFRSDLKYFEKDLKNLESKARRQNVSGDVLEEIKRIHRETEELNGIINQPFSDDYSWDFVNDVFGKSFFTSPRFWTQRDKEIDKMILMILDRYETYFKEACSRSVKLHEILQSIHDDESSLNQDLISEEANQILEDMEESTSKLNEEVIQMRKEFQGNFETVEKGIEKIEKLRN